MVKPSHKAFQSESGDLYLIPVEQWEKDVPVYRLAVEEGNEDLMMYYETGMSGWVFQDGE